MWGFWSAVWCAIFFPLFLNLQGLFQAEGCNQTLGRTSGTFTSPRFPQNYKDDTLCSWTIEADPNHIILLSFSEFQLESESTCKYDYVVVYDGRNANYPLLGQYCGDTLPNTTRSTGNKMYIVFKTDGSGTFKGFSAAYSQDCVTGKYGVRCAESCSANCRTKECISSDGTCTKGCKNGYYDKKCNKNCSKNCKGDTCKQDGGQCEKGCEIGYRGDKCDDTCSRGWYGLECKESCPSKCSSGYCHHVTGMCAYGCERGYRGRFCESACGEGTYGYRCSGTCSSTCRSKLCNHVNGSCTDGCVDGFYGDTCDKECLTGTYGPNCNMTCSATCYINVTHVHSCHHQTGVCLQGCIKGYTGDQCEIKLPDDSTSNVTVGAGVGVTVTLFVCVIIALIAVYLYKKRGYLKRRAPQPTKPTTAQQQKPSGRVGNKRQEQEDEHYYESYDGAKAMTASASQVAAAETMEEKTEYENADVGHYEDIIEMESLDGRGLYENNTYGFVTATAEEISKRVKGKGYQPTPLAMMMLKLPSQK